jgi:predicted DsbA family dithiol-disulfide isomerase
MLYKQTVVAIAALTFCFSAGQTFAGPAENPLAKVDWQVQGEWKLPSAPLDVVYSLDQKHVFVLTDQHQVLIYDPTGKIEGSIPVSKGVKAIDIAPRGENLYLIDSDKNMFTSLAVDFILPINIAGSPFLGKENAPVTIVEFSDFECPYCSEAVPLLEETLKKNPDTVKLVFKNMPLSAHRYAELAARAALAAKEQGKFWEFHNELFSTKNLNAQTIDAIAVKLKLDIARFKQDIVSPKVQQEIVQDLKDAETAGVTGTPALFINGRALRNRSLPVIQELINDELKNVKSNH